MKILKTNKFVTIKVFLETRMLKIFWLTKKIGHRKSWIFLMQLFIGISLLIWSSIDPEKNLFLIILIGLLIAIFSSTQDISIDALRIEQIKSYESNIMAAAASMAVIGWWTGFKIGGLLSLFISDYFEKVGFYNYWQITFIFLFFILMLLNFLLLTIEEVSKKLSNKNKFDFLKNSKISIFGNRTIGGWLIFMTPPELKVLLNWLFNVSRFATLL